jgi:hypothetical protein
MCRDCQFAVMEARLSRQRLGGKPCLGESNVASAQQVESLSKRNTFGSDLRTKGFQPSCAQNRLAQNQNCIRLGLGRFSEVP